MAAPAAETPLELTDEQRQTGTAVSRTLAILSPLLLVLGLLHIVSGVVRFGDEKLLALLDIVVGAITAFMAIVLLNARDSAGYLSEVKGYEKTHLLNFTASLGVFAKVQIALGVIVALVSLIRLLA
jgi:hypothetical protein